MAERVELTVQAAPGAYDYDGAPLTFAAADAVNKNSFTSTGTEVVIAYNSSDAADATVTITSVADNLGRTKDATKLVAKGAYHMFGPIATPGWRQANGQVYLEASDAAVKFAVIRL
jgi:hypothetical protein